MTLDLHVAGDRWRAHLQACAQAHPHLVPVIKGNGYGFTNATLARRAEWLGADVVAVGTYDEVAEVAARTTAHLLVLTPWREFHAPLEPALARRVWHTVSSVADVHALRERDPEATVLPEVATSMRRHGMAVAELAQWGRLGNVAGLTVHFPLAGGHAAELSAVLDDPRVAALPTRTVFVSHLTTAELDGLRVRHPDWTLRPRIGTALWLGDREALTVTAKVLDVHHLRKGDTFGYRGRAATHAHHLVVASGGTAHGIGLEAPRSDLSAKGRLTSLAKGAVEAAGRTRSPYLWNGEQLWFAEPPHMQASLLVVDSAPPAVGDSLEVRVRFTATRCDHVIIS